MFSDFCDADRADDFLVRELSASPLGASDDDEFCVLCDATSARAESSEASFRSFLDSEAPVRDGTCI